MLQRPTWEIYRLARMLSNKTIAPEQPVRSENGNLITTTIFLISSSTIWPSVVLLSTCQLGSFAFLVFDSQWQRTIVKEVWARRGVKDLAQNITRRKAFVSDICSYVEKRCKSIIQPGTSRRENFEKTWGKTWKLMAKVICEKLIKLLKRENTGLPCRETLENLRKT